jgi:mannose-6-phosphate isomerase
MGPILFKPDFKERVWGGQKLKTVYGKEIPYTHTGESWEVACHENGQSIVANGPYEGYTLEELLLEKGEELVGKPYHKGDKFPLLIKIIDAKEDLSVQVHPDDAYAFINEKGELGKSEAWVILEADEGAKLIAGLKKGTTKELFVRALESGDLESVMNQVEVKLGDVINIPAGLIHAIGTGILLAEVQQNSDTTYRVYDWNRVGLDGMGRELHIEQSIETIDFDEKHSTECVQGCKVIRDDVQHNYYILNQYFALETIQIVSYYEQAKGNSFEIYMILEGSGHLMTNQGSLEVNKGDSLMIPADMRNYKFEGAMKVLKTYVPEEVESTLKALEAKGVEIGAITLA